MWLLHTWATLCFLHINDLERVTKQAYAMVAYYGMSENVGTLSYYDSTGQSDMAFTKPYSELTAQQIDAEAKLVIGKAYEILSIGSLAVAIAVVILIGLWAANEYSFDKFQKDAPADSPRRRR